MRSVLCTSIVALISVTTIQAQQVKTDAFKKMLENENKDTVAWIHAGTLNIGFNEGFLHNWSAGGELGALAVNTLFSGSLVRFDHRDIWTNNMDLAYGLYYAYSNHFVPHKTDDRIDLTSKYGIRLDSSKNFYLTGLFNFKSQFTKAYDYGMPVWDTASTSKFFSPAYFTIAAGMEYRRGTDVSLFYSPIAARITLADRYYTSQSKDGAFGIPYGKTSLFQLGSYFSGRYVKNFNKFVTFKTRLDLYSNYLAKDRVESDGTVIHNSPTNIYVLWDNLLTWKISKLFNLTFGLSCIYDNDIPYSSTYVDNTGKVVDKGEPGENLGWLQTKQIFTLGFLYKI